MNSEKTYKIREIFYTLQGEGGRAGEASIFIRFAHCNLNCWFCDTDWSYGKDMTLPQIVDELARYPKGWIVWTGGEPTLQLTSEIVSFFKEMGYKQAIETNGTNRPSEGLDYITISPKVPAILLHSNFKRMVIDEIRYPCSEEEKPPKISELPLAKNYYVSPIFLGEEKKRFEIDYYALQFCIDFVLANPEWKLSVQQHKIWNIS